jgi:hypothetical protein
MLGRCHFCDPKLGTLSPTSCSMKGARGHHARQQHHTSTPHASAFSLASLQWQMLSPHSPRPPFPFPRFPASRTRAERGHAMAGLAKLTASAWFRSPNAPSTEPPTPACPPHLTAPPPPFLRISWPLECCCQCSFDRRATGHHGLATSGHYEPSCCFPWNRTRPLELPRPFPASLRRRGARQPAPWSPRTPCAWSGQPGPPPTELGSSTRARGPPGAPSPLSRRR